MLFKIFTCLLIGISTVRSAPLDDAQQKLQETLKETLNPVDIEVRAMIDTGKVAFAAAGNDAMDEAKKMINSGKELVTSAKQDDRLNLGLNRATNSLRNLQHSLQNRQKALLQRLLTDINPPLSHAKSALLGARKAINEVQNQYLTADGQDLVRRVFNVSP